MQIVSNPTNNQQPASVSPEPQDVPRGQKTCAIAFVALFVVLGVFFRFHNLDGKLYWNDELRTCMTVSGYRLHDIQSGLFDGKIKSVSQFTKYLQVNGSGPADVIRCLSRASYQVPLYHLLVQSWARCFQDTKLAARLLSALLGVLLIPAIYWLAWELFRCRRAATIAIALTALSPFHLLYAQEARSYSLWALTIAVSSAALLYAMRSKTIFGWAGFCCSLVLSLYTHTLSIVVAASYALYVALIERFQRTSTTRAFLYVLLVAALSLVPWFFIVATIPPTAWKGLEWLEDSRAISESATIWMRNFVCPFLEIWSDGLIAQVLSVSVCILEAAAVFSLLRRADPRVSWFLVCLGALSALSLLLPDLLWGGRRGTITRYLTPLILSMQLCLAYFFAHKIVSRRLFERRAYGLLLVVLIGAAAFSCLRVSQAKIWWSKGAGECLLISSIVNEAENPLIVTTDNPSRNVRDMAVLSNLLHERVKMLLARDAKIPDIPGVASDRAEGTDKIFLLRPSANLIQRIEKDHGRRVVPVAGPAALYTVAE